MSRVEATGPERQLTAYNRSSLPTGRTPWTGRALALLVLAACGSASAQEPGELAEKFSLHGFLTQGYGIADNNQYLGIPEDGTAAYRTAALQFRYALTKNDNFVMQFSHEILGSSATNALRSDVELDWAFYDRKFGGASSLRVGRVPLPIGIFNETKDVGTLLPFYRASTGIYGDGTWTSDTIDGVVLSHEFGSGNKWSLDADVYFGNYKRIEDDPSVPAVAIAEISNAVGGQLWLQTPLRGLRIGYGFNRADATDGLFQPGYTQEITNAYYSVDADFERFTVRGEYFRNGYTGGFWKALYLELLLKLNSKLMLMGNYETGDLRFSIPDVFVLDRNWNKEPGVGIRYAFRSDLVLRLERHWHKGVDIENAGPIDTLNSPLLKANYTLVSLSTSF